jgi:hypothetical protein
MTSHATGLSPKAQEHAVYGYAQLDHAPPRTHAYTCVVLLGAYSLFVCRVAECSAWLFMDAV